MTPGERDQAGRRCQVQRRGAMRAKGDEASRTTCETLQRRAAGFLRQSRKGEQIQQSDDLDLLTFLSALITLASDLSGWRGSGVLPLRLPQTSVAGSATPAHWWYEAVQGAGGPEPSHLGIAAG